MSEDGYDSAAGFEEEDELSTISYQAVGAGLPVVTRSGDQFGVVEHVLEVPELDLFDGIVVYTGTGLAAVRPQKSEAHARHEMLRLGQLGGWLRFVDADQVLAITPGYVKCTFERSQVELLPVPAGPPVLHPDMAREDQLASHAWYGRWFDRPNSAGRARWIRKRN